MAERGFASMNGLDFVITVGNTPGEIRVQLDVALSAVPSHHAAEGLELFLPTWTPGSYLIREFARHLTRVEATDLRTGETLECRKVRKNRFRVDGRSAGAVVRLCYRVYAHELSVRTADVTDAHAFWNNACVLLWPVNAPQLPAQITVEFPEAWELACALPTRASPTGGEGPTNGRRRVTMIASDMEHAYDSPCLVGRFERRSWLVDGVLHEVVLDGLAGVVPPANLVGDLQRIVQAAAAVFDGPLPYSRYLFLCLFTADGHGGLEHGSSTTLLMSRTALRSDTGYREFLALAAHELFHAWNVKRMRPVEFWQYDYENENYTSFLWLLEGWTAYYDDLLCLRAGLMSRSDYLAIVAKSIQSVLTGPGRLRSSLSESSFDAWIRLYRPDENTRNSSQNYYVNGSVAAMCLDLMVRSSTNGQRSLDDVLRRLYRETFLAGRGFTHADVRSAITAETNTTIAGEALALVLGSLTPDLTSLLGAVGIRIVLRDVERPYLGLQFEAGSTIVASVTSDAPAHAAGMQPGDEILAIGDLRADSTRWQDVFTAVARAGEPLAISVAGRGAILRVQAPPARSPGTVNLEIVEDVAPSTALLRERWLPAAKTTAEQG